MAQPRLLAWPRRSVVEDLEIANPATLSAIARRCLDCAYGLACMEPKPGCGHDPNQPVGHDARCPTAVGLHNFQR